MSDDDTEGLVNYLAENPDAGDEIPGTGGCRKLRWAAHGKGKRGGVRVITFFSGRTIPVFLITVFGKNERADLTKGERNELRKLTKAISSEYSEQIRKVGTK